jgi:hypothetical protein
MNFMFTPRNGLTARGFFFKVIIFKTQADLVGLLCGEKKSSAKQSPFVHLRAFASLWRKKIFSQTKSLCASSCLRVFVANSKLFAFFYQPDSYCFITLHQLCNINARMVMICQLNSTISGNVSSLFYCPSENVRYS